MKASEILQAIENLRELGLEKSYNHVISQMSDILIKSGYFIGGLTDKAIINAFISLKQK